MLAFLFGFVLAGIFLIVFLGSLYLSVLYKIQIDHLLFILGLLCAFIAMYFILKYFNEDILKTLAIFPTTG